MLPAGYKGMQQTEVKKISDYLDSFIKKEVKIDYLLNEIRNEIADLAVLAASKVVGKTIDVADHQNMVDNFVKEVGEAK